MRGPHAGYFTRSTSRGAAYAGPTRRLYMKRHGPGNSISRASACCERSKPLSAAIEPVVLFRREYAPALGAPSGGGSGEAATPLIRLVRGRLETMRGGWVSRGMPEPARSSRPVLSRRQMAHSIVVSWRWRHRPPATRRSPRRLSRIWIQDAGHRMGPYPAPFSRGRSASGYPGPRSPEGNSCAWVSSAIHEIRPR